MKQPFKFVLQIDSFLAESALRTMCTVYLP